MRNNVLAGVLAGLISGVIFGVMMQLMQAPTPDGTKVPMMAMVAQVVGSSSLAVGWVYHLFNSAVIGGIFGWLLGPKTADRTGRATVLGAGYGIGDTSSMAWSSARRSCGCAGGFTGQTFMPDTLEAACLS